MTSESTFDPRSKGASAARDAYTRRTKRQLSPYVYTDDIILAVKVALATDRPLLLRGVPGTGKSTLAEDVAVCLGRRYYEHVVSSRTKARDLLWQFDAVRRLGDAQTRRAGAKIDELPRYIEPGVLWWALDPASAMRRGLPGKAKLPFQEATDPAGLLGHRGQDAVVLLDEIDKAEPDMPNDLLVPLGAKHFHVTEAARDVVAERKVLVVITTNEERDLSPAFLRRCIMKELPLPTDLESIVRAHFAKIDDALLEGILERFAALLKAAEDQNLHPPPATAELIDAVRASLELGYKVGSKPWDKVMLATVWKHQEEPKLAQAPKLAPSSEKP